MMDPQALAEMARKVAAYWEQMARKATDEIQRQRWLDYAASNRALAEWRERAR